MPRYSQEQYDEMRQMQPDHIKNLPELDFQRLMDLPGVYERRYRGYSMKVMRQAFNLSVKDLGVEGNVIAKFAQTDPDVVTVIIKPTSPEYDDAASQIASFTLPEHAQILQS